MFLDMIRFEMTYNWELRNNSLYECSIWNNLLMYMSMMSLFYCSSNLIFSLKISLAMTVIIASLWMKWSEKSKMLISTWRKSSLILSIIYYLLNELTIHVNKNSSFCRGYSWKSLIKALIKQRNEIICARKMIENVRLI